MRNGLPLISAVLASALTLGSCSDEITQDSFVYTDVLAVVSSDSDTGSLFALGDRLMADPAVVLDPERVSPGDCILCRYTFTDATAEPAVIDVSGLSTITNGKVLLSNPDNYSNISQEPVSLLSAWLNGSHLIIRCTLPYDTTPRMLQLIADSESPSDLYLIHSRGDEAAPSFSREYYLAYDIATLPSAGELTLHVNTSDGVTTVSL